MYLDEVNFRTCLKASGLAAGKGVLLPSTKEEAHEGLKVIEFPCHFSAFRDAFLKSITM